MGQKPTNKVRAAQASGAAVIEKLGTLRDSHRLGLLMWENTRGTPGHTGSTGLALDKVESATIAQQAATRSDVVSASLVPSAKSQTGMIPFFASPNKLKSGGYLLDLSEHQAHPPHVLLAAEFDQHSGFEVKKPGLITGIPQLREVHALSGGEPYVDLSARWLDALGTGLENPDHRQQPRVPFGSDQHNIIDHTEIQAVCAREHVTAIVLPHYTRAPVPAWYDAGVRLQGALNGLAHLRRGEDYPVVTYHVNGEAAGTFGFIGQGTRALNAAALQAIRELKQDPALFEAFQKALPKTSISALTYAQLHASVLELTGLDLDQPSALLLQQLDSPKRGRDRASDHTP